jgi:hypothetical protein
MTIAPEVSAKPTVIPAVNVPAELENREGLVLRQARAIVIASDDDYDAGRQFLEEVILEGKRQVTDLFDGPKDGPPGPYRILFNALADMRKVKALHLAPWEQAENIVRPALGDYIVKRQARQFAEDKRRREEAERLERERIDQEAQAIRAEAERRAQELRDQAATAGEAGADTSLLEAQALEVEEAGKVEAEAVAAEPVAVAITTSTAPKLKGTASTWKCDRAQWDPEAFAQWIAEDPKGRAKYIGAPAWTLLDAEAKAQKSRFAVRGIVAGPAASVRVLRGGGR